MTQVSDIALDIFVIRFYRVRFAEDERLQARLCVQPTSSGDGASTEMSVLLGQVQVSTSLLHFYNYVVPNSRA